MNYIDAKYRLYRGYKIIWQGTQDAGHWLICDSELRPIILASAQDEELDRMIDELDELESEG